MNKDTDKTKEQLLAELTELRIKSKAQEEKLKLLHKELDAKAFHKTKGLKESEHNYQMLFNESPVPTWEEDFSLCKTYIDSLKNRNIKNFREYFEKNPDEVSEASKKVKIIDINRAAIKLHKAQSKQEILHSLASVFTDKSHETFTEQLICIAEGKKEYESEGIVKTLAGFKKNILIKWAVVPGYEDTLEKVYVTTTDITDRKQAEEALQESEIKFRNLSESTNMGIALFQNDYWIYANPAAEGISGYTFDELKQMKFWEFIAPEYVDLIKERGKVRQKGKLAPSGYEFKIITKQGKEKWVLLTGNSTELKSGKAGLITVLDITKRKQAEEKLRANNQQLIASEKALMESEEKFRKAFTTSPDSININRLEDGMYISINDGFTKITGYAKSDVIGKTSLEINIWDKPGDREKLLEGLRRHGQVQNLEAQFRMKNGKVIYGLMSATVITLNGVHHIISITRDITNRKKAEESLRNSEETFKGLFNSTSDAIYVQDEDGVFLDVNQGAVNMYGYTREELIGNTPELVSAPGKNDLKFVNDCIQKVNNGEPQQFEFWGMRKNGEIFPKIVSLSTGKYFGKKIILAFATDITERKQAEAELTKLSTAVTQSPSVIEITDTDGTLEYINPKCTEITGYSPEEAIGQNPRILKSGEHPPEMYEELWETISSGKVWRGEFHNKKKNGEWYWELASISPIFDKQGKIINYVKVAEDITERKLAEDNYRNSIDESPLGIRIVNKAGKTIYVNKALLEIYEFSSLNEFNNTKAIDRYTEKSYKEHQERKKIRQAGRDASVYEISIRRKNGEIRHIKVWRKEVVWNREKHFQVINQDITELKRLNTDLILAKEKAEESNRLKTAFLNNMSHEIRTPLNGITGFIGLLQDSEIDDEAKQEYFDIINKSSDRLITTVTDILNISRIEAGEVKVTNTEVSINEILEEQYSFFYHEAKSKGLELIYNPGFLDKETHFVTDKHKLEGILTNLIKNAIKFTETGSITFGYAIKTLGEKNIVEFYVKDTGIGIPANRIDAIFNRFEQADIEDTRVFEGSGLGLAISKSYVEMLGGEITVSSEIGSGSTFTFTLPYTKPFKKKSDDKGKVTKEMQTLLSHLSVIIAEDDETSRLFFDALFKNEFKNITSTQTGQETIEFCRENPETDLILMDIKMPGMNGYDATREIRKFNGDVIIIAQTAFGLTGDREKALEAGCNDYIAKPIKKDKLEIIIRKHFKNYKN